MDQMNPIELGKNLTALLQEQKANYEELLRLTDEQRSLIEENKSEKLLGLLGRRQRLVDAVSEVSRRLAPYQQNWEQVKTKIPHEFKARIQELLDSLHEMLNLVLAKDQEDCKELMSRKQQISTELNSASKGRVANKAYSGAAGAYGAGSATGHFEISG